VSHGGGFTLEAPSLARGATDSRSKTAGAVLRTPLGILTKIFGATEEGLEEGGQVAPDATAARAPDADGDAAPPAKEVLRKSGVRAAGEGQAEPDPAPARERRAPIRPPPLPSPEEYPPPSSPEASLAEPAQRLPAPSEWVGPNVPARPPSTPPARRPLPPPPSSRGIVPRTPGATVVTAVSLTEEELRAHEGARGSLPTMIGLGLSGSVARALAAGDARAVEIVASAAEPTAPVADQTASEPEIVEELPATPNDDGAPGSTSDADNSEPLEQARLTMPTETSKAAKQTLIEEGTEFKGTLKSSCPVVVNGSIDGEIEAPEITITRSGTVAGTLKAKRVRSQGTLSGNVDAGDVFLSGSVRSNTVIKAKSLEVKLGSERAQLEVTFGECDLEVSETAAAETDTTALFAGDLPDNGNGGSSLWKKRLEAGA
jgi:cytoskeletal protein CcmA (bactofilin family)